MLLNDYSFKTGGYAIFNDLGSIGTEHLQIPAWGDNEGRTGMYKVRLIHQLNNGSFDLTDDVWKKFFQHKKLLGQLKYIE